MMSLKGEARIKRLEGFSLTAYPDAGGYSIGWGHYLGSDVQHVRVTINDEAAQQFWERDIERLVNEPLREIYDARLQQGLSPLSDWKNDALGSFAYNVPGFVGSNVYEAACAYPEDHPQPAALMLTWTKANGVRNRNLVEHRRWADYLLYLFEDYGD